MRRRSIIKSTTAISAAAALGLSIGACSVEEDGGDSSSGDSDTSDIDFGLPEGEGEIKIGLIPGWDEGVVSTELWRQALTSAGYDVTVEEIGEAGLLYEAVASGDVDIYLDAWLPVTHASYMEEYGDQLEMLGAWNENAALTVAVPAYVDEVDSLADLNDHADLFDNTIVGIEPSAGLTEAVQTATIPTYGIDDMTLETSSTSTMLAELDSAIAAEEPIVVTLWQPHRAYTQYELKNLEDPEGTLGEAESIETVATMGFSEEFPEIAEAFGNFALTVDQIHELEAAVYLENDGDAEAGVRAWLAENDPKQLFS